MHVLVAPQEFKGTLSAHEAALAIEEGIHRFDPAWTCERMPMADGGPGTLDALVHARGGERRASRALDPLQRQVEAEWAVLSSGTAVIECASASGLWRLTPEERDPRRASTFGTGQLIAAALDAGCRELIIGLGGSATNDGGAGMAQALGYRLLDARDRDIASGGAALAMLQRIDASGAHPALEAAKISGAIDVTNPLCGPLGASAIFGPQKGADTNAVKELDAALARFAAVIRRDLGIDVLDLPGGGAAGGLGAGLAAFLGAALEPGGELVAEAAGYRERLARADVVITGEGRLDGQTGFGKGPATLAALARVAGKRSVCIAGILGEGSEDAGEVFDLIEVSGNIRDGLPSPAEAAQQLSAAAERVASRLAVFGV
jgi:glycerate kinase